VRARKGTQDRAVHLIFWITCKVSSLSSLLLQKKFLEMQMGVAGLEEEISQL
jgi:hypothetical protein